jgi:PAS domain S-box-containing protein
MRQRAVLDALPDYAAYITPDHVYRLTNAAYRRLFDLDPNSIVGRHVRDVLGEQGYAFSKPNLDRALEGETVEVESVVLIEGGAPHLAVRYVPDVHPDGTVQGVIVHARDVTDQRAVELELDRVRKRLDAQVDVLYRNAPVILFATDADGVITHSEGLALDKIGLRDGELVGVDVFEAYADHHAITDSLGRILREGQAEVTYRDEIDGRCLETHAAALPPDERGRPTGLVGVAVDVTEREEALAERKRVAEQLRRRNAELEEFAYVASHDLQEPLRTITSFIQLLQRRNPDAFSKGENAEYMGFVTDAATRMRALISDLLAYSRIGRIEDAEQPVDLQQVFEDTRTDLAAQIEEAQATVEAPEPLPTLTARPGQIQLLLRNLISNAVKFRHPDRSPHVSVSAERVQRTWRSSGEEDGPGWRLRVKDDGIGIAPEHLGRIFAVFKRLHTRDRYDGTGIGLAACKKVVENRGGCIWAESEPGAGTTILVDWPDASRE